MPEENEIAKNRRELGESILTKLPGWLKEKSIPKEPAPHEQVLLAISKGDFHKAFVPLKIIGDEDHLIHTFFKDKHLSKPVLIRHAPNGLNTTPQTSYAQVAEVGLNFANGVKDLIDIAADRGRQTTRAYESNISQTPVTPAEKFQEELREKSQAFYLNLAATTMLAPQEAREKKADEILSEFYHKELIPLVMKSTKELTGEEINTEVAMTRLRIARDFANMKQTPYAIATVTNCSDQTIGNMIELELPIVELTENQKSQYNQMENQPWFTGHDPITQKLIEKYKIQISSGSAMIPAQLIYQLPGVRNGFEKWTAVTPNCKKEPQIVNKTFHAGSPGHLFDSDASQEATGQSIKQLKEATGADFLFINTLVTPGHSKKDRRLVKQIKSGAIEDSKVFVVNTPINGMRFRQDPDVTAFETWLIIYAKIELVKTTHVEKKSNLNVCLEDLNDALNARPRWFRFIRLLFFDKDNSNLQIASRANLLIHAMNEACGKTKYALVSGCVSGQDRGGALSTHTSNLAVCNYIATKMPNALEKISELISNAKKLLIRVCGYQAKARHTSNMAGSYCTGNADGIKFRKGIFPSVYKEYEQDLTTNKRASGFGLIPTSSSFATSLGEMNEINPKKGIKANLTGEQDRAHKEKYQQLKDANDALIRQEKAKAKAKVKVKAAVKAEQKKGGNKSSCHANNPNILMAGRRTPSKVGSMNPPLLTQIPCR